MTQTPQPHTHTIDATGRRLGRLASEVARLLRGKHLPAARPHQVTPVRVVVEHASHMDITARKQDGTEYTRYSGYPGGLKKETMRQVAAKKGYAEVLRRAVYGMIPANRLRAPIMKNLTIKE